MKRQHLTICDAIRLYGLPDFELSTEDLLLFQDFLTAHSKVRIYQKYEQLETIDSNRPLYLYFILQGLAHAYYQCPHSDRFWGQYIWYRHDCIYFPLEDKTRKSEEYHIQVLEETTILSIPWSEIPQLVAHVPPIKKVIKKLHRRLRKDEQQYHYRNNLPAKHRVQLFLERHATLPHRTSQEVCAMHNQLSRHWYSKILIELKTSS